MESNEKLVQLSVGELLANAILRVHAGNLYPNCLILRSKCMNYILKVYTLCVYILIYYMVCHEALYKLLL